MKGFTIMERNRFIDVLKGILIIFVIVLHFPFEEAERQLYLFPFGIAMTVPCFMMLSGYVSALSFQRRKLGGLEEAYMFVPIMEKVLRFTVPFAMAFVAEWIVFRAFGLYKVGVRTYGMLALAMDFLRGGKGQGSYYYPMMIQLIFVFPVIYHVIKKHNLKGLIYCFVANGVFEVLKTAYSMNETEYRLWIFRYLFIIAAGCYVAIGKIPEGKKRIIISAICILVGLGFAYVFSYTSYTSKIITFWCGSSFVVCLFIVPIVGGMIRYVHFGCMPLEIVGRASFNIFLVQMIYYNFAEKIYEIIPGRGVQLLFNIVNCVVVGVIFYYIEQPLTKYLINGIKKHVQRHCH